MVPFCPLTVSPLSDTRYSSTLLSAMVKALPWPWFISISWYKYYLRYSVSRSTHGQKNYKKQQRNHNILCLFRIDTKYNKSYVRINTNKIVPNNDDKQQPQHTLTKTISKPAFLYELPHQPWWQPRRNTNKQQLLSFFNNQSTTYTTLTTMTKQRFTSTLLSDNNNDDITSEGDDNNIV